MPLEYEEFNFISQTKNPSIPDNTQYIWILSSRHTVKESHSNCPKNPLFYYSATQNAAAQECDVQDDFQRIKKAIEIGCEITAKRCAKLLSELTQDDYEQFAPYILYNGLPDQNKDLLEVIENLPQWSLPNYAKSKFIIFDIKGVVNTGTQFNSLAELQLTDTRLSTLAEGKSPVTIVTSAYHIPRVRRYFNSEKFKNPFKSDTLLTLVGIDREFQRPRAMEDCEGEVKRIKDYTATKDLGIPLCCSWYDINSSKNWRPLKNKRA